MRAQIRTVIKSVKPKRYYAVFYTQQNFRLFVYSNSRYKLLLVYILSIVSIVSENTQFCKTLV